MINLYLGQKILVKIERMGINGEGIGYYKRRLIFVPYALPSEEVTVEITENQPRFSRAKIVTLHKKSSYRVEPADPDYAALSSSHILHLTYPQQLIFKRDLLAQALQKYRPIGYKTYELRPTFGMATPIHYRNKLQYQVRRLPNGRVIAGLYKENSHHLVALQKCIVENETTQAIMTRLCKLFESEKTPIYDERHIGGIRTVMVRRARATGEVQLVFISSIPVEVLGNKVPERSKSVQPSKNARPNFHGEKEAVITHFETLIQRVTEEFPEIETVSVNYHPRKTSEIYGEVTEVVWRRHEKDTITERVRNYSFELSPRAFYQLNSQQADVLYGEVVKALRPVSADRVIDAYCGVGTIGFSIADKVKSVHGMDSIPESIADARENAKRLGFKNCHYEVGKAEKVIPNMMKSGQRPTAIIVDPPRTGLDEALIVALLRQSPEKMVYVSCNVSTLAKDLVHLTQVYKVDYIQSVDMFPHTARTEAVVKLTRKKA